MPRWNVMSPKDFTIAIRAACAGRSPKRAHLRSAIHADGVWTPAAASVVLPLLSEVADPWAYYLTAALFAACPEPTDRVQRVGSIGEAFRVVLARIPTTEKGRRRAVENEMTRLLSTDREQLPRVLLHAVAVCMRERVLFAWSSLLEDLLGWEDDDGEVQRRLAAEMWGESKRTPARDDDGADDADLDS